ncbi:hypothetical protein NDN08_006408 [Rhodosorus marinus]|uniref:SUN domain-containing protein n=1 Tax=Rhodosorus marinus TaxID=101924 RepID=A0AAV8UKT4_9RHOD|nr:hypothetical protein NDN08_006408 [Rhodosorus marinus]
MKYIVLLFSVIVLGCLGDFQGPRNVSILSRYPRNNATAVLASSSLFFMRKGKTSRVEDAHRTKGELLPEVSLNPSPPTRNAIGLCAAVTSSSFFLLEMQKTCGKLSRRGRRARKARGGEVKVREDWCPREDDFRHFFYAGGHEEILKEEGWRTKFRNAFVKVRNTFKGEEKTTDAPVEGVDSCLAPADLGSAEECLYVDAEDEPQQPDGLGDPPSSEAHPPCCMVSNSGVWRARILSQSTWEDRRLVLWRKREMLILTRSRKRTERFLCALEAQLESHLTTETTWTRVDGEGRPTSPKPRKTPKPVLPSVEGWDQRLESHRVNFASVDLGARVLDFSGGSLGVSNILRRDADSYMLCPCRDRLRFVVVELSEEIVVEAVEISNQEYYSSSPEQVLLLGSGRYPCEKWKRLGLFDFDSVIQKQALVLENSSIARYLKIVFIGNHKNAYYCPITEVRVHGKTLIDDWKEAIEIEHAEEPVTTESNSLLSRRFPFPPLLPPREGRYDNIFRRLTQTIRSLHFNQTRLQEAIDGQIDRFESDLRGLKYDSSLSRREVLKMSELAWSANTRLMSEMATLKRLTSWAFAFAIIALIALVFSVLLQMRSYLLGAPDEVLGRSRNSIAERPGPGRNGVGNSRPVDEGKKARRKKGGQPERRSSQKSMKPPPNGKNRRPPSVDRSAGSLQQKPARPLPALPPLSRLKSKSAQDVAALLKG